MTVLELVRRLRRLLDDFGGHTGDGWTSDDTPCLWGNVELTGYLDEALYEFLRRNPIRDSSTSATSAPYTVLDLVTGQHTYQIHPRVVDIYEILDEEGIPLTKTTIEKIDTDTYNWRNAPNADPHTYMEQENNHSIRFYPPPSSDRQYTMTVGRLHTALSLSWDLADVQTPELDDKDAVTIVEYAASIAYQKQDNETNKPELSSYYENRFDKRAGPRLDKRTERIRREARDLKMRTRTYY